MLAGDTDKMHSAGWPTAVKSLFGKPSEPFLLVVVLLLVLGLSGCFDYEDEEEDEDEPSPAFSKHQNS